MWTVSVLGQSPRQLREDASGFGVSADGTHIAFRPSGAKDYTEIWVMGSQATNPQKALSFGENEWIGGVHWSPDGQRLAYIRDLDVGDREAEPIDLQFGDRSRLSIETCDLKGASRTVVVSADRGLWLEDFYWLPEGRIVYARLESPYSTDGNLWQIGIDNRAGTPTGKPKRITPWAGYHLWGLSANADGKRLVFQ